MDPLQAVPMPTHGVTVGLTAHNTWQSATDDGTVYVAYVATNSTQTLSFASLAAAPGSVVRIVSRRSFSAEYQYGVVIELHGSRKLADNEVIFISLAQSGATTYYPPQPIQD